MNPKTMNRKGTLLNIECQAPRRVIPMFVANVKTEIIISPLVATAIVFSHSGIEDWSKMMPSNSSIEERESEEAD